MLAFSLLSFAATLKTGFIWDDHQMITANPYIKSFTAANLKHNLLSNAFNQEGASYYRPLQLIGYMADFRLFKLNPIGWHAVNFFFHFISAFFVFLLLKKLDFSPKISFLASAFFAVNPTGVEQMILIAGRAELMSFAFTLLAILLFLEGGGFYYFLSLLSFALSCLSKESGVVTPLFLLLALWFYAKKEEGGGRPSILGISYADWLKTLPYFLLIPFYLVLRKAAVVSPLVEINPWDFTVNLVLRMPYVFFNYFYKTLFPFNLHSHNLMTGFNIYSYAALVVVIAFLKYLVFLKNRNKIFIFALLWYAAGLLPKLPLLGAQNLALDHWTYPGNLGFFLVMAYGLSRLEAKAWKTSVFLSVFFISSWAAFSNYNISQRDSDVKIYENAIKYPTSTKVYYNLSREYYLRGDFLRARRTLERVKDASGDEEMFLNAYALALWKTGDAAEAVELLFSIMNRGAKTPATYLNLAAIYAEDGNYVPAAKVLLAGSYAFPEDENLKLYLARIYGISGKKAEAGLILENIITSNPYNPEALLNLGIMEFGRKNYAESGKYLKRLLGVAPDNAQAREYLEKIKSISN